MAEKYPKPAAKPATPAPTAPEAITGGALFDNPTSSPAAPVPATEAGELNAKFENGWRLLGDLFRGQFRKPASGTFKDNEERDWWLIRGDVARISLALEQKNWMQLVFGLEQLARDVGVDFTAADMRAISRAIVNAADTLPLVAGSDTTPTPALPKQPEKE